MSFSCMYFPCIWSTCIKKECAYTHVFTVYLIFKQLKFIEAKSFQIKKNYRKSSNNASRILIKTHETTFSLSIKIKT